MTVAQMHRGLLELLAERVQTEPVVLGATVGMGGDELGRSLLSNTIGHALDPDLAGGDTNLLAARLTREVIERVQPLPIETLEDPDPTAEHARSQVARHYAGQLGPALAAARGEPNSDWRLAQALGSLADRPLIVVHNAHRMPASVNWELRDLASEGAIRIMLLTRPDHTASLTSRTAPFFGLGWHAEMPTLPLLLWAKTHPEIGPDLLRSLLERTRYRTAATLDVLQRLTTDKQQVGFAWFSAVSERIERAYELLHVVRAIHELAPRLLLGLARSKGPYAALAGERPDRVSLVLRRLRACELVEQPKPRTWQIADPFLSGALARLQRSESAIELFPDGPVHGSTQAT